MKKSVLNPKPVPQPGGANQPATLDNGLEDLEVSLLLEAIDKRYGYDFTNYAPASLRRRLNHFLTLTGCGAISELIPGLLRDPEFFRTLISVLSVPVTEMFRDPFVYQAIRRDVLPFLRTYPHLKIWHAGCATGEEAYSMAILLHEEGLAGRCLIYATDFDERSLAKAREGIFPLARIKEYTENYNKSGARGSLSEYYHAGYDSIILRQELRDSIVFANHNLATDSVFGEMQFILCRNVLIYFGRTLQDRVLTLFMNSLCPGGFLCLGTKESPRFSTVEEKLKIIDGKAKIYQRRME